MQNYSEQIVEYLEANFTPSDGDKANFKHTTASLLKFLWLTFPNGCISDFELNEILLELGYTREIWVEETPVELEERGKVIHELHKTLITGWCLKSEFDLQKDSWVITDVGKEKN
ncbi:MAG: hypothetical protein EOO20_03265 [Chryseobacterium sp.]|nr:MAG: hypothetical protein EOO20_03265 [Chryseobacterium sp.]